MKRDVTPEEMLVRMAGLCAGAEQCSADVREKILKKGFSSDDADKMIGYLTRHKYIDDSRYARAYAADKVRFSGWGRMKIRMHLRSKRLPDDVISQGLGYIDETDYLESLRKVLFSKAKGLELTEVSDRQKLFRHLASRGFESELIIREMKEYAKRNH